MVISLGSRALPLVARNRRQSGVRAPGWTVNRPAGAPPERQQLRDARLPEGAVYEPRPGDQGDLVSAPLAEAAAQRDHRHSYRVDVGEAAEVQRDAGDSFFAKAIY